MAFASYLCHIMWLAFLRVNRINNLLSSFFSSTFKCSLKVNIELQKEDSQQGRSTLWTQKRNIAILQDLKEFKIASATTSFPPQNVILKSTGMAQLILLARYSLGIQGKLLNLPDGKSSTSLHSSPVQEHMNINPPSSFFSLIKHCFELESSNVCPYSVFSGSWHIVSNVTFSSFCLLGMKRRKLKSKEEYFTKGADRTAPAPKLSLSRTQKGFKECHTFCSSFPEWGKFGCVWASHPGAFVQRHSYSCIIVPPSSKECLWNSYPELFKLMLNELLWTSEHTFGFCGHCVDSKNLWEIMIKTALFPQNLRNF